MQQPTQPAGRLLHLPTNRPALGLVRPQQASVPKANWTDHTFYLSRHWRPEDGGHITVIAPTGRGGKTWMVTRGLLPFFEDFRVLYIDVKDRDKSLFPAKGKRFFKHYTTEPPSRLQVAWASSPKHFHLHVRSGLAGGGSLRKQATTIWQAVANAYKQQDWIIVVDEIKFLTANFPDGLGMYGTFRDIWTRGRSNVTLIAMTQSPSWIPTEAYGQANHLYLGRLNAEGNKRLGEIGGTVDYKYVRDALGGVHKRQFLYIDKGADEPEQGMMITGL